MERPARLHARAAIALCPGGRSQSDGMFQRIREASSGGICCSCWFARYQGALPADGVHHLAVMVPLMTMAVYWVVFDAGPDGA